MRRGKNLTANPVDLGTTGRWKMAVYLGWFSSEIRVSLEKSGLHPKSPFKKTLDFRPCFWLAKLN